MIKAVIFDLYETLITEFDPDYKANFSLEVDRSIFDQEWKKRKEKRMKGEFADYKAAVRDIMKAIGQSITETELNELHDKRVAKKTKPFAQVHEDIIQMLEGIKDTGVRIGLISDCAVEEVAAWPDSALPPYFDEVTFSYQAGIAKPNPEIYLRTCEKLDVQPSNAAFIGDGGSDELNGAFRAGLTPYQATWFLDFWPNAEEKKKNRFRKVNRPLDVLHFVGMTR
ncbi:MAG TPA: HAD family hydrolase [Bacillales bacterium]|nr:HAD family hydrolase [Bacillales bacterium]